MTVSHVVLKGSVVDFTVSISADTHRTVVQRETAEGGQLRAITFAPDPIAAMLKLLTCTFQGRASCHPSSDLRRNHSCLVSYWER